MFYSIDNMPEKRKIGGSDEKQFSDECQPGMHNKDVHQETGRPSSKGILGDNGAIDRGSNEGFWGYFGIKKP